MRARDFVADHSAVMHALSGYSAPGRVSCEEEVGGSAKTPTNANTHDKFPDHDPAVCLHGGLVLGMVHPSDRTLRLG
jgi:hypothetical protein